MPQPQHRRQRIAGIGRAGNGEMPSDEATKNGMNRCYRAGQARMGQPRKHRLCPRLSASSLSAFGQDLKRGQRLAFKHFQERPAAG